MNNNDELLTVYSVYVSALLSVENKRQTTNQVYFSLSVALITAFTSINGFAVEIASLLLGLVSFIWLFTIGYYRSLSAAKFKVIFDLESKFEFQPFKKEWAHVSAHQKMIGIARLEMMAPIVISIIAIVLYLEDI